MEVRVHQTASPWTATLAERFSVHELPAAVALPQLLDDATASLRHRGAPTFRGMQRFAEQSFGLQPGERVRPHARALQDAAVHTKEEL